MTAVSVSWLFVGAYVTFVVGASLFVGLMNPLVNLPTCDNNGARGLEPPQAQEMIARNWVQEEIMPRIQIQDEAAVPEPVQRAKRDLEPLNPYLEKVNDFRQNYQHSLVNSWFYPKVEDVLNRDVNDICDELTNPQSGVIYPWYLPRLPTIIKPINYNIELLLNDFDLPIDGGEFGFITATFQVTNSTNFILVHSAINDVPFVDRVLDKNQNEVNITCVGQFPFLRNDYFIIKTSDFLTPANSPYTVRFLFFDVPAKGEKGIFTLDYGGTSPLLVTKFQPIDARRAYPVFDEPGLKATYDLLFYHRNDYITLANTPSKLDNDTTDISNTTASYYEQTPPMPSYLIGFISFNKNDFSSVSREINSPNGPITLSIWARNVYINNGFADDPLDMCDKILFALFDIFRNVDEASFPPKIDVIAVPDYPVDGIGHFGLPIFKENKILFKLATASERDKQNAAFLFAKTFAEFWFGNFVTFGWWDELWLSEGLASYIKYNAIQEVYGEWNINTEFITEDLIPALISDGYPSSHPTYKNITNPYEIEEYYDDIESSKPAAIFRWIENEFNSLTVYTALTAYLNANPWGVGDISVFYNSIGTIGSKNWTAKDFFDRWTIQSNFPLVRVEVTGTAPTQQVTFTQFRSLNTNYSIFAGDLLYPSPWGFIWFIPIECQVGTGPSNIDDSTRLVRFYVDQRTETYTLPAAPAGKSWQWINCDKDFVGYYEAEYTNDNIEAIGDALQSGNINFEPEDRANIIHNLFLNAFSERGSYFLVRDVLDYLTIEDDFLPWRTAFIHLNQIASVLQYRKSFFQVATWFGFLLDTYEQRVDIWNATDVHIENLLRETVGSLACFLQDSACLAKTPELWAEIKPFLSNGDFASAPVAAYAREIVYNYHIQNTNDLDDWDQILFDYDNIADLSESRKLLEALTFTRLPWLLARTQSDPDYFQRTDFFSLLKLLSQSSVGRELVWDFFRTNYNTIIEDYTEDDPRIGQLLIDIVRTFETEFLFYELLEFIFNLGSGATANARFKALEIVSTNVVWLADKEQEIIDAFSIGRDSKEANHRLSKFLQPKKLINKKTPLEVFARAEKEFKSKLAQSDLDVFARFKAKLA